MLTVGANHGGTSRNAHYTMHEDSSTRAEHFFDEQTRIRKVNKDVLIFRVLYRNDHGIGLGIERMFYTDG